MSITLKDRRLLRLWKVRGEGMTLRELEIAHVALGELYATKALQGQYPHASLSYELHEETIAESEAAQ